MRPLRIPTILALLVSVTVPALAQMTGPNLLGALGDQLRTSLVEYRVEGTAGEIHLIDRASGSDVLAVRQDNAFTVTFSATIAHLGPLGAAARMAIARRIMQFNLSSAVGTLWFDPSGDVTMVHRVNPTVVSLASMVKVASLCGIAVREQSRLLAQ